MTITDRLTEHAVISDMIMTCHELSDGPPEAFFFVPFILEDNLSYSCCHCPHPSSNRYPLSPGPLKYGKVYPFLPHPFSRLWLSQCTEEELIYNEATQCLEERRGSCRLDPNAIHLTRHPPKIKAITDSGCPDGTDEPIGQRRDKTAET